MNASATQARHDAGTKRAGVSMGGKFAREERTQASGVGLFYAPLSNANNQRDELIARFSELGYVPAVSVESATNPRYTDGIDQWWSQHYERMEQPADGQAFAMMPDDYTPKGTSGHALSGKRRTHRMLYSGAGVNLRMPSATAIRRFSAESGKRTFDVPVELEHSEGRISGFVRVTQGAGGVWDVQALNMPPKAAARAAESVSCVLEARRPTIALKQAEAQYAARRTSKVNATLQGSSPLHQRRVDRVAAEGARLAVPRVKSPVVKSLGYDRGTGTMTIRLKNRYYGYQVPPEVYQEIGNSTSPGAAYNQLVKAKGAKRVGVTHCPKCRHWTAAGVQHKCGTAQRGRRKSDQFRKTVAGYVLTLASMLRES